MELAHDLQLKLLPSTARFTDYARIAARCVPASAWAATSTTSSASPAAASAS
jgi:hypothetical protein